MLLGNIKIQDGGDERKVGSIQNKAVRPFVTRIQEAIEARKQMLHEQQARAIAAASSLSATSTQAPVDIASQLERLADLMDRGILTPEEFAEQKAKLLNG